MAWLQHWLTDWHFMIINCGKNESTNATPSYATIRIDYFELKAIMKLQRKDFSALPFSPYEQNIIFPL